MNHGAPSWRHWGVLAGLGVLLLQVTAAAQTQPPVQTCIHEALQQYKRLRYERALKRLDTCLRLPVRTEKETASLLLYKGSVLAELRKKEEVALIFKEALRLMPGAMLPIEVSPKISQQFEAVGAAMDPSPPAQPPPKVLVPAPAPAGPGPATPSPHRVVSPMSVLMGACLVWLAWATGQYARLRERGADAATSEAGAVPMNHA